MNPVHLLERLQKLVWVGQGYEAIASAVTSSSVPNYSCHLERGVSPEESRQQVVTDFVAQVATENSVVVFRPVLHGLVFPHHTCCLTHVMIFRLFFFLYLFTLANRLCFLLLFLLLLLQGLLILFLLLLFLFPFDLDSIIGDFTRIQLFVFKEVVEFIVETLELFSLGELDFTLQFRLHKRTLIIITQTASLHTTLLSVTLQIVWFC